MDLEQFLISSIFKFLKHNNFDKAIWGTNLICYEGEIPHGKTDYISQSKMWSDFSELEKRLKDHKTILIQRIKTNYKPL